MTMQQSETPASAPSTNGVIWFELYVDDLDRARAFYQRLFGWVTRPFLEHDPTGDYLLVSYAEGTRPQGALVRRAGPPPPAGGGCVIYVEVPALEAAVEVALATGGALVEGRRPVGSAPDGGVFATVTDPAGQPDRDLVPGLTRP